MEDRGEASKVFAVFTKDFGRLELAGKAVRKMASKLRSGLSLFSLAELEFIQGRNRKTLTDASSIERFQNIRNDLNKLRIVQKISDVLGQLIRGQEADIELWELISEVFYKINDLEVKNSPGVRNLKLEIIYYYFLWNLFSVLGYLPNLYNCSACQKKLAPEGIFSGTDKSGFVCESCNIKREGRKISQEAIKIARLMVNHDWLTLMKLKVSGEDLKQLSLVSEINLAEIFQRTS